MVTDQNRRVLRINSEGGVPLFVVIQLLAAVEQAYNGVLAFDSIVDRLTRPRRFEDSDHRDDVYLRLTLDASIRGNGPDGLLSDGQIAAYVLPKDRLVLSAAQLSSPGFWAFLGSLNALETIRRGLQDHHERRKDREYREAAEAQQLDLENERRMLENELLQTDILERRIALARQLGATEADLAPLLNHLVYGPIDRLTQFQDRAVIGPVEIREIAEGEQG